MLSDMFRSAARAIMEMGLKMILVKGMTEHYRIDAIAVDDDAVGDYYFEVANGYIVRQINVLKGVLYWATRAECRDGHYDFTDRPKFCPVGNEDKVSEAFFNQLWKRAMEQ